VVPSLEHLTVDLIPMKLAMVCCWLPELVEAKLDQVSQQEHQREDFLQQQGRLVRWLQKLQREDFLQQQGHLVG
jgi:hypothetical protein